MIKHLTLGMLALGIAVAFIACEKDGLFSQEELDLIEQIAATDDKTTIDSERLPAEVTTYVTSNYAPFLVEYAFLARGLGYELEIEDGRNAYFREDGSFLGDSESLRNRRGHRPHRPHRGPRPWHADGARCLRGTDLTLDDLPQGAQDQVAEQFPDAEIVTVVGKRAGIFGIELSDGTILIYHEETDTLRECGGDDDGPHPGHFTRGCMRGDTIDLGELPQTAQDYVTENYPDLTIEVVVVKPRGAFGVELSDGTKLLFNEAGEYLTECGVRPGVFCSGGEAVAIEDLPDAITSYVEENHPDTTIERAAIKFNGKYFLHLSDGTRLIFDADGTIIYDSSN